MGMQGKDHRDDVGDSSAVEACHETFMTSKRAMVSASD